MALFDNPRFWTWQNCYVTTSGRNRPEAQSSRARASGSLGAFSDITR